MQSTKPYLIRAIHEWCVDQGFTPYLSVAVDATTRVPQEFVKDGNIVLNVGLEATHQLELANDQVSFQARFNGRVFPVLVPINRVAAIYSRENGQGMAFDVTDSEPEESVLSATDVKRSTKGTQKSSPSALPSDDGDNNQSGGRSHLTRIK